MSGGIPSPQVGLRRVLWRDGAASGGVRAVAEEIPVAFSYDNAAHSVMMATPADLRDFAVGFSLTEGVVASTAEILDIEIVPVAAGINLRIWLADGPADAFAARRRRAVGPAGCGMCGLESLAEANRAVPVVHSDFRVDAAEIAAAMAAMAAAQSLGAATRAVHAAGFWQPGQALLLREDVGRHNALDKLAGAIALGGRDAAAGMLVMSSRISVELVQKAAMIGAAVLVAVSAPTALAVRIAEAAGMTLVGVARADGFEVFTHADRVLLEAAAHAG
jgi:FdhD protein